MFNSRNQQSGEPFNAFVSDLRIKATTCEYGELKDELIRDRIVTGITKNNVQKQLLKEADLTLVKAIQVCQVNELSEQQLDQLGQAQKLDQSDTEVHKVNIRRFGGKPRQVPPPSKPKLVLPSSIKRDTYRPSSNTDSQVNCRNCGFRHEKKKCRAFGKQCLNCKKWNHFQNVCQSPSVNEVCDYEQDDYDYDDSTGEVYKIESVENCVKNKEMCVNLLINNKNVTFKLDTGAKCNVISKQTFDQICQNEILDTTKVVKLVAFGGSAIHALGSVNFKCRSEKQTNTLRMHVVDKNVQPILGIIDCVKLNLVRMSSEVHELEVNSVANKQVHEVDLVEEYKDLFDGTLGKLDAEYKITLDQTVPPVVIPPRRVPVAMHDQVQAELDRMVKIGNNHCIRAYRLGKCHGHDAQKRKK